MDNNRNLQTNLYKNHTKTKFMEENSMKKNNKNKANNKKRIVTSLLLVALALLMVVGVFMLSRFISCPSWFGFVYVSMMWTKFYPYLTCDFIPVTQQVTVRPLQLPAEAKS